MRSGAEEEAVIGDVKGARLEGVGGVVARWVCAGGLGTPNCCCRQSHDT